MGRKKASVQERSFFSASPQLVILSRSRVWLLELRGSKQIQQAERYVHISLQWSAELKISS